MTATPLLGTTVSTLKLAELNLPLLPTFQKVIGMQFDLLRLSVVWSEVENNQGEFDFSTITSLLALCEKANQNVVLTVGMKAPRWPEFHFPNWVTPDPTDTETQQATLQLLNETIQHLQHFTCITHWQVENEPLDPSGPKHMHIPNEFLKQEVEMIRQFDDRPIVLTAWGNDLVQRKTLSSLSITADVIGLDLYFKQFMFNSPLGPVYSGPRSSIDKIKQQTQQLLQPLWIAELQAEPWEAGEFEHQGKEPKSISPQLMLTNYQRVLALEPAAIFFWGVEYWLWQAQQGNPQYLSMFEQIKNQTI